jgi:hypothetical protein
LKKSTVLKTRHYLERKSRLDRANLASSKLDLYAKRAGHMNVRDFRRIALGFEGVVESSHMGAADFRVGGRIFATLASAKQGYGNLMLTVEQQRAFVLELPDVFLPIPGGWGRMGMTHIRLAAASEEVLAGALHTAWKVRIEKNTKPAGKADAAKKSKSSRTTRE